MKGKPKYKEGQKVSFFLDGKIITGDVYIIDKYGCFEDNSDVCYDVMTDNCLYKHINEKSLTECYF